MSCDYAIGKCLGCGKPVTWDFPYCNVECVPVEIVYEAMGRLAEEARERRLRKEDINGNS